MTVGTVALPFACGFEMGSGDLVYDAEQNGAISASSGTVHTGSYSFQANAAAYLRWSLTTTRADIYLSAWIYYTTWRIPQIIITTGSGETLRVSVSDSNVDALVDGSTVANGAISVPTSAWFHVEVYFSLANAGGEIKTWIDGIADIDYTGDTQPGTSDQIAKFWFRNVLNDNGCFFDDVHANSSRLYDRRVLPAAVPNSDNTSQLTASSGGDNYADVDELGPDGDTTYVSTATDAQKDLYGHGGITLTTYTTPYWVTLWARPRKTVANGDQMRLVLSSSGTEETGDFEDLMTTYQGYIQKLWVNDPNTSAPWADEAAIDAALIGIESNIP